MTADGYCGECRKIVPTEWRHVTWSEPGCVTVQRQRVLVVHYTHMAWSTSLGRCPESGKLAWPMPPTPWMTASEADYAGPEDELPAVEIPHQGGTMGMTANMHYVPSQRDDVELGPLGEYGCLDAPFED